MELHQAVKPLCWLVGKWRSVCAKGCYPNIEPFIYKEKMEFISFGQPMLNYKSITWDPESHCPLHLASGFLLVKPSSTEVAFLVAHNLGMTTVESGCIEETSMSLKSTDIGLMDFVKDPKVVQIARSFNFDSIKQELEVQLSMQTCDTPLKPYLRATFEKDPF